MCVSGSCRLVVRVSTSSGGGGYIKQLGLNQPITVQNTVSCQLALRITRTEQEGVTGVVISLSGRQILTVTGLYCQFCSRYSEYIYSSLDVSLLVIERWELQLLVVSMGRKDQPELINFSPAGSLIDLIDQPHTSSYTLASTHMGTLGHSVIIQI